MDIEIMGQDSETAKNETSGKQKKYYNLDWTMARTVLLSVLVGVMAAFAAKALLIAIHYTQAYIHPIPITELVKNEGIGNATLRLLDVGMLVLFGLVIIQRNQRRR